MVVPLVDLTVLEVYLVHIMSTNTINIIEYITISSTGNTQYFGDYLVSNEFSASQVVQQVDRFWYKQPFKKQH